MIFIALQALDPREAQFFRAFSARLGRGVYDGRVRYQAYGSSGLRPDEPSTFAMIFRPFGPGIAVGQRMS